MECNKLEGFWQSRSEPDLPMPVEYALPWEGKARFLADLDKVEASLKPESYRGFSTCRLCFVANGSQEYEFNGWCWPSGYRHYIDAHNVIPSGEFARAITSGAENAGR